MYKIKVLGFLEYYKYIIAYFGIKELLKLTDSGYPKIFALGWCLHSWEEIVICKVGNYDLRKWHELGHYVGFDHINQQGHVMHPWGIFRGRKGIEEIEEALKNA